MESAGRLGSCPFARKSTACVERYYRLNNEALWRPTKFVIRGGRLRASLDRTQIGVGSRLVGDAVAACYEQYVPLHARGRLVDLGCGRAPLYGTYRKHVNSVTCVDWGGSLHDNPYLDLLADLNTPLPFADASFDTVILSDVLEHLAEPRLLWAEVQRVLTSDGKLLLNVPFLYRIHEAPHDYARYTDFALRRFAEQSGLQILVLQPIGGSLAVFADLVGKHLEQGGVVGRAMAACVHAVASAVIRTGPLRRADVASAAAFPLGYFMAAVKPATT